MFYVLLGSKNIHNQSYTNIYRMGYLEVWGRPEPTRANAGMISARHVTISRKKQGLHTCPAPICGPYDFSTRCLSSPSGKGVQGLFV